MAKYGIDKSVMPMIMFKYNKKQMRNKTKM